MAEIPAVTGAMSYNESSQSWGKRVVSSSASA